MADLTGREIIREGRATMNHELCVGAVKRISALEYNEILEMINCLNTWGAMTEKKQIEFEKWVIGYTDNLRYSRYREEVEKEKAREEAEDDDDEEDTKE